MKCIATVGRFVLAFGAALALTACDDDPELITPPPGPGGELFTSYVALGNSITAGWQSSGINDSTQRESYARLLAQSAQTRYAYAALAMPGCPPPILNWQTGARVGMGLSTTCALRTPGSVTAALNNVAVPGATVADPTASSSSASNALTTFVLGGQTQVDRALDADPTFVSIWIGNNDVLEPAASGLLTPTPGFSRGVTPVATFQAEYDEMLDELSQARRLRGGVLIGVVNTAQAPLLFPVIAFQNPQFLAGWDAITGQSNTVHPNCTNSTALISFALAPQIRSGAHPALIACEPGTVPNTLVGDVFVLDPAEQTLLANTVAAYNAHISAAAAALDFAYFDPNPALSALKASGCITTVPNLAAAATASPFGTCISLDGVHPARPGHIAVTNALIAGINAEYGTSLAPVQ